MKNELIKLADILDKKGLRKEADLVDSLIKQAGPEGIAQSLALALEGVAKALSEIASPQAIGNHMNTFVTQLIGAKDKFEAESARLATELEKQPTAKASLNKSAIITNEMAERVRGAAAPAAKAATQLLEIIKKSPPKSKQELDNLLNKFKPISGVIEKIQRASGV